MKSHLRIFALVLGLLAISISALTRAEVGDDSLAALHEAIKGFDQTYATNDVEGYFSYYASDATVYFYGERQDMAAYHELWTTLMAEGGGVEKNTMSDAQLQVLPGGHVAVSTYFVDNRTRYPDGSTTSAKAFETDVWQLIDGNWKIISLHFSEIQPTEE